MSQQRDHVPDRELGDAHGARGRRVHDDDLARSRFVDVDVVAADPGAADDLEARRPGEDLFRYLGPTAYDQGVIFGDRREESLPVQVAYVAIVPIPEYIARRPVAA